MEYLSIILIVGFLCTFIAMILFFSNLHLRLDNFSNEILKKISESKNE